MSDNSGRRGDPPWLFGYDYRLQQGQLGDRRGNDPSLFQQFDTMGLGGEQERLLNNARRLKESINQSMDAEYAQILKRSLSTTAGTVKVSRRESLRRWLLNAYWGARFNLARPFQWLADKLRGHTLQGLD